MNIVLFDESEINQSLKKGDERFEHCVKILKKKVGDSFDAGIIGGMAGKAVIKSLDENEIHFEFEPLTDGKKLYPLTMMIGFPRPIQLKRLFRDMAGLGVEKILLCGTELGEKSYMQGDIARVEKARELLKEGSVQAASTHVPEIEKFDDVRLCLSSIEKSDDVFLVALDNINPECSLSDFLGRIDFTKKTRIVAAIGSERGWTDSERAMFKKARFTLCSMGCRVLRTETASTVAASIILDRMGVLK
ncbi:MAG: 16S rRNA (uracil(1498)-N(3))-methyltransferase [Treponemataceae bacterium]|nr:16S rRNA (uracil(1498)-N(3))-methyltransferase [Treponemataceae bacterium]